MDGKTIVEAWLGAPAEELFDSRHLIAAIDAALAAANQKGQVAMRERAADVCKVMSPWDECLERAEDVIRALPVE